MEEGKKWEREEGGSMGLCVKRDELTKVVYSRVTLFTPRRWSVGEYKRERERGNVEA